MALTKISRGLLNTGVSDSSDATAITIDSSEKVGLNGLSAGDYWSSSNQLVLGNTASGANGGLTIATASDAVGQIYFADGTSGDAQYRGQIQYTHVSDAMDFQTAAGFRMRIDSSGNVGIGTASPIRPLHLHGATSGDIVFAITNNSTGATTSDGFNIIVEGPTPDVILRNRENSNMRFFTNNTEAMRIQSSGELLIGSTAIGSVGGVSSSHWSQALSGTKWCHTLKNSNSTPYGLAIKYSAIPNDSGKAFIYCEDGAPAARFEVRSDGGLKNYSANDVNLSDEREKKNIVAADNQLENIKNLLIKSFHYNEDDNSADKRLGVIAQEVETNLPHLVDEYSNIGGEERKGVKEQQIMWMAIKAIQELSTKLEAAEARITTLEE